MKLHSLPVVKFHPLLFIIGSAMLAAPAFVVSAFRVEAREGPAPAQSSPIAGIHFTLDRNGYTDGPAFAAILDAYNAKGKKINYPAGAIAVRFNDPSLTRFLYATSKGIALKALVSDASTMTFYVVANPAVTRTVTIEQYGPLSGNYTLKGARVYNGKVFPVLIELGIKDFRGRLTSFMKTTEGNTLARYEERGEATFSGDATSTGGRLSLHGTSWFKKNPSNRTGVPFTASALGPWDFTLFEGQYLVGSRSLVGTLRGPDFYLPSAVFTFKDR